MRQPVRVQSLHVTPGRLGAALVLLSAMAAACGGESSTSPPPAAPTASASAPIASAPASASAAPIASTSAAPAEPAPPEEISQTEYDQAGSELVEHYHHHSGGVAHMIALALDSLRITDEQRSTIDGIRASLRAKLEPARAAEHSLLEVLASGVAAGKFDKGKVSAATNQVSNASGSAHAAIADALNQLHAALNEPQRIALVDKVQAHWQVWQKANESSPAQPGPAAGASHGGDHLDRLARELSLTPDQVDKVRTELGASAAKSHEHFDRDKVEGHLKAFAKAFESPEFDAKKWKPEGVNAQLSTWHATHLVRFFETVTPVLTPDQRTLLAQHLRERANPEPAPSGS